jgi:hypothetical protein
MDHRPVTFMGRARDRRQARKAAASAAAKQAFVDALEELGHREYVPEAERFLATRPVSDPGAFSWLTVANPLWRWEYQLSWILGLGAETDPESLAAEGLDAEAGEFSEQAAHVIGLRRKAAQINDLAAERRRAIESGARPLDPDRLEHERELQARSPKPKVFSVDAKGARKVVWPEYVFAHLDGLGLDEQAHRAAELLAGYDLIDIDVWAGVNSTSDKLCAAAGIDAETRRFLRQYEFLEDL